MLFVHALFRRRSNVHAHAVNRTKKAVSLRSGPATGSEKSVKGSNSPDWSGCETVYVHSDWKLMLVQLHAA